MCKRGKYFLSTVRKCSFQVLLCYQVDLQYYVLLLHLLNLMQLHLIFWHLFIAALILVQVLINCEVLILIKLWSSNIVVKVSCVQGPRLLTSTHSWFQLFMNNLHRLPQPISCWASALSLLARGSTAAKRSDKEHVDFFDFSRTCLDCLFRVGSWILGRKKNVWICLLRLLIWKCESRFLEMWEKKPEHNCKIRSTIRRKKTVYF